MIVHDVVALAQGMRGRGEAMQEGIKMFRTDSWGVNQIYAFIVGQNARCVPIPHIDRYAMASLYEPARQLVHMELDPAKVSRDPLLSDEGDLEPRAGQGN